jgi:hypothetical protein
MAKLLWDQIGEKFYETGVDHGILFVNESGTYGEGVAWNGLTTVTESPSGAEASPIYADNIKYLNLYSAEEFGCTIEAYTYPDEFGVCDGSADIATGISIGQQERKSFGFAYRTRLGNDTEGDSYGEKLHLIYGCRASTTQKGYSTVNDSPEAINFSWEVTTTPVPVTGFRPTANVIIDSRKTDETKYKQLLAIIEGTDDTYTKLSTEPEDWSTNYANYYTKDTTGKYVAVTGDSAPTWAADTYYSKTAGTASRLPLPEEIMDLMAAG